MSPFEKFLGIKTVQSIKNEHPLFCPVYVLDNRLQGSLGGLLKWEPRSCIAIYVGHSSDHAENVALVFNPTMKLVSPQYHVFFDESFSTINFLKS